MRIIRSSSKYITIFIIILLVSCAQDKDKTRKKPANKKKEVEESLVQANKKVVKTEEQHILDLINRYQWDMKESGTGLRYMIYEEGDGEAISKGDIVELDYEIRLITGDIVYTSEKLGQLVFTVGKAEVISGLEEGILLLHVGDRAKFVIPSHLAFGLLGDDDKIPTKATLIYDIEVIRIK